MTVRLSDLKLGFGQELSRQRSWQMRSLNSVAWSLLMPWKFSAPQYVCFQHRICTVPQCCHRLVAAETVDLHRQMRTVPKPTPCPSILWNYLLFNLPVIFTPNFKNRK